jgi:AraC-like DNA-binding protein/mannose-6-phosphate isomerase-like protein (cupin superfamily)
MVNEGGVLLEGPVRHTDLDIKVSIGDMLVNIFYINYEPPASSWQFPYHCHSSYELHYISKGKGILDVPGQRFLIGPGTFYLTGPGIYHKQLADSSEPMDEYCINFEIKLRRRKRLKSDSFLPAETEELFAVLQDTTFWFGKDEFGSISLFQAIMDEFQNRWLGQYTVIQSLVSQIIVQAVRSFTQNRESGSRIPRKIPNDSRRFLVDDYFRDPGMKLTPADLAVKIGVSVRQLERLMKQYYGMTFHDRLRLSRLEQARDELIHTTDTVSSIAERLGYSSPGHFARLFREHSGMTPSEYRESMQSKP